MTLDVHTLFMTTVYVEALLGLLLLFVWVQNTQIHAVAWWGFAHLLRAGSVALFGMYGSAPNLITIDLANAILFTAFAVTWTGARVFDGRPVEPVYLITGAVIWLLVSHLPGLSETVHGRALVASAIITAYTWLTAYEFWRGRGENLVSRWPAIFMLFAHGSLFLLRTPLLALLPWGPGNDIYGSVWLTVLSFEALLFTISIAFILLAMTKERTELWHRTAAMVDPLTGIANRRAFLQEAKLLAKWDSGDSRPVAVLVLDIDHFKSVNDRFGHAIGDRTLEAFADTARMALRATDLIGRLGGEEFAAVLMDITPDQSLALAERLREGFARAAQDIDGRPVRATVSIGMVHCTGAVREIADLLGRADQALYFAKENGRNRVEVAALDPSVERNNEPARAVASISTLIAKDA
ncbi:MAG TPA: GGDEF domain-containing protein [Pseudolabrys sp.]|nr:GGDEF domain-containing protein [Pseudolabrys sp.]